MHVADGALPRVVLPVHMHLAGVATRLWSEMRQIGSIDSFFPSRVRFRPQSHAYSWLTPRLAENRTQIRAVASRELDDRFIWTGFTGTFQSRSRAGEADQWAS